MAGSYRFLMNRRLEASHEGKRGRDVDGGGDVTVASDDITKQRVTTKSLVSNFGRNGGILDVPTARSGAYRGRGGVLNRTSSCEA